MKKLTLEEASKIELSKWPGHLVVGNPIRPQQAQELLIRTDTLHFSGNYPEQEVPYFQALYPDLPDADVEEGRTAVRVDSYFNDYQEAYHYKSMVLQELAVLNLEYLYNDRIISSYVGGPHGWCDVNGQIFQNTGNVGKWPRVEEIYKEWCTIAQAFPYLNLKSQLLDKEYCEEDAAPVIEYHVHDGEVEMFVPESKIVENYFNKDIAWNFMNRNEFGVSVEWFKQGLDRLRSTKQD